MRQDRVTARGRVPAARSLLGVMLRTGALLLLGAGHTCLAGPAPDCSAPAEVAEIAPGAFVRQGTTALPDPVNRGAIANIGFIIGERSVAVIDSGGSHCDGLRLREAIRLRTVLPVSHVINTHVHPDHVLGNSAFAGAGVSFFAHRNLPRAMAERGSHYLRSYGEQAGAAAMDGTTLVAPTELVADRAQIDLGGRVLQLVAHKPAHTDHDLTVFDMASGILWTGDLIFIDHLPVLDGSLKGWLAQTRQLMRHEARQIVPGHGAPGAPLPQAAKNQLYYLERLEADLRQALAAGETIGQAASRAAGSERAAWKLFDDFNSRNATTGFAELEWD